MGETFNRKHWIDVARGIGILCVVAGHWITIDVLGAKGYAFCNLLYAFHMPLFFVISGMLCRHTFHVKVVLAKMDSLLVPYFLYTPIILVCLGLSGSFTFEQWVDGIRAFLLFDGVSVSWFFPCLFAVDLAGIFLVSHIGHARTIVIYVLMCVCLGLLLNADGVCRIVRQVFKCRTVPMALAFWLCGYLAQKVGVFEKKWRVAVRVLFVIACAAGCSLRLNYRCNFSHAIIGNPFIFYLAAFSGVSLVMLLAKSIGKNMFLEWCGRNSILILIAHSVVPSLTFAIRGGGNIVLVNIVLTAALCIALSHMGALFSGHMPIFQRLAKDTK